MTVKMLRKHLNKIPKKLQNDEIYLVVQDNLGSCIIRDIGNICIMSDSCSKEIILIYIRSDE